MPHASFGDATPTHFDWGAQQPQRMLKNGADYYSGSIVLLSDADFRAMWAMRAIVNVRPAADGADRIYVDSWADPASIQHTLSMNDGGELHTAILTDFSMDQRYWSGDHATPGARLIAGVAAKAEFLLLS